MALTTNFLRQSLFNKPSNCSHVI